MKRTLPLAFSILALIAIAAIVAVLFAARGLPDDARAELNGYLAYRYLSASAPSILRASQAKWPRVYKPQMSSGTYSDSVHYRTMHNSRAAAQPVRWPSGTEPIKELARDYSGNRPLPYPPQEIWCVQLASADGGVNVVLVALHMDLYNADWIVHELPTAWSAAVRQDLLEFLGCEGQ